MLFEDPRGFLGAVGLFGHWIALRVPEVPRGGRDRAVQPQLLYLGSAVA